MILAIIQSSFVLFLAICAVGLLRKQSAATRHAILTAGLISSLGAPFVGRVLPEFEHGSGVYSVVQDHTEILWTLDADVKPATAALPTRTAATTGHPFRWIWFAGMTLGGIVLIAGGVRIALLVFRSKPLSRERWSAISQEISGCFRLKRRIRLLQNDRCVLGTWGVLRPKVFLPGDAGEWPDDRIRAVLLHELAHIKRFDWPVQMLAEIARAVYWFNPLFWLACRWLRSESEHACDDVVLNAGIDAKDYAGHLLDLARTLNNSDRGWSPVLAMSRPPHLERRFVAMLNPSLNHRSVPRAAAVVIFAVALCVMLPVAALRAHEPAPPPLAQPLPGPPTVIRASALAPRTAAPVAALVASKPAPRKPVAVQGFNDPGLSGTVFDGTGAVVPGVRITLTAINQQSTAETTTGSAGEYGFRPLAAGLYLLAAELPGFMNASRRVEIKAGPVSRQNITLFVGGVAERVVVSAAVGRPGPAPFPGTPQRIRVGGNVQAANLVSQVKPDYPQSARDAGIEGTVHLQGIIGVDGTLIGLRAVSSNEPRLIKAALEAVKQWRYRPTLLNNEPVEVITEIDVQFELSR